MGREIHNPVTGERYVEVTRGSATGGAYVEGKGFLPVGTRPPGVHRHPNQDELVTVVKGRICARIGKEEREFGPGESAILPRGQWHDFWVVGDEPAETIARATPALGIEMILATLTGLAIEGKTDKKGRPRPLQGAVIGQFYREVAEFKTPPRRCSTCCYPCWPPSAAGGASVRTTTATSSRARSRRSSPTGPPTDPGTATGARRRNAGRRLARPGRVSYVTVKVSLLDRVDGRVLDVGVVGVDAVGAGGEVDADVDGGRRLRSRRGPRSAGRGWWRRR